MATDTITVTPKSATAMQASPNIKNVKSKIPTGTSVLANAAFGCEHLETMMQQARPKMISHYNKMFSNAIDETTGIISQTYKNPDSKPATTLRPTYMCMQCPIITNEQSKDKHFETKGHAFMVESRSGCIYCAGCGDFVYDPALEDVRHRRGKKRKLNSNDEPTASPASHTPSIEDQRLVAAFSTFIPCRATGLRGLYNMGQTCFMSVILQSLIHNPFIKSYYLSEMHKKDDCEKESCTSCAMDDIFTEFYREEKTEGYGAVSMLLGSWMAAQSLAGYKQQDAHEYMQFILNNLHLESQSDNEAQNGSDAPSPPSDDADKASNCTCIIHRTFYGKLQSTVTCDKCKNTTTAIDPFMDLSLDIRNVAKKKKIKQDADANGDGGAVQSSTIGLIDCLERFTGKEKLAKDDYSCSKCGGQQSATKQLSIQKLPPVLCVHFKRFEQDQAKKKGSKIESRVSFPTTLDLYPYSTRAKKASTTNKNWGKMSVSTDNDGGHNHDRESATTQFELSSVVVHKGGMDSGHYVNYCREGDEWFLFDDSKVVLVSEREVLQAEAYLLVYVVRSLE